MSEENGHNGLVKPEGLPEGHKVPDGAMLLAGEDDGRCRVVRADGSRCKAPRLRGDVLCGGHAGRGMVALDPSAAAHQANAVKAKLRARRELLGIGPARVAQPRQIARLRAAERAEEAAAALVDAPLDDPKLGSMERQRAVLNMLDALYPLATASVELELPADGASVNGLGWAELQQLAARIAE